MWRGIALYEGCMTETTRKLYFRPTMPMMELIGMLLLIVASQMR